MASLPFNYLLSFSSSPSSSSSSSSSQHTLRPSLRLLSSRRRGSIALRGRPSFAEVAKLIRCMSAEVNEEAKGEEGDSPVVDPRRGLEERFAVLNTGQWECRSCGHVYDQYKGDATYPIPPGFDFASLPEDWRCPTCGAAKSYFNSKSIEVAGFAQNQRYGLGTNTLTSGQKSILIYGALLFAFFLFISGYFLQ